MAGEEHDQWVGGSGGRQKATNYGNKTIQINTASNSRKGKVQG